MKGIIVNYRGTPRRKKGNQAVIEVADYESREKAEELVGKKVSWETPGDKKIKGKITSPHGNSGAVRALFEKGLPGQAIGTEVEIKNGKKSKKKKGKKKKDKEKKQKKKSKKSKSKKTKKKKDKKEDKKSSKKKKSDKKKNKSESKKSDSK